MKKYRKLNRSQGIQGIYLAREPMIPLETLAAKNILLNSLQDAGTVKLIECTNAHLALLIANDSRTKKFCQLAGDRTLAVPLSQETKFRNALRQVGYVLPQRDK